MQYNSAQGFDIHARHGVNSRQSYEDVEKQKMTTIAKEANVGNLPYYVNMEGFKVFLIDSLTKIGGNN